jgi:hypothetical protein
MFHFLLLIKRKAPSLDMMAVMSRKMLRWWCYSVPIEVTAITTNSFVDSTVRQNSCDVHAFYYTQFFEKCNRFVYLF